ncbi:hypothetical protein DUNSADRAFT_8076 [Dunaliella salina]|uniref:MYND-type domain-containing protein n=1 Tax=Dunaliella salina TaxID=3046 RepID=A0ABQ7GK28_DUNSA|nr:hypothetical protein DUNSADRAFT_8076 [Dunaliella salina]|eukprot:KAF5834976.1 hypothetical protein DUNSADRAFT_8076 [Dunaliella salina]
MQVVQLLADAKSDEVLQEMASSADVYKGMAAYSVSTIESHLKKLREGKQASASKDAKQEEDGKGNAKGTKASAAQGPKKDKATSAEPGRGGPGSAAAAETQQQKQQWRRERQEEEASQQQKAEKPLHVCIGCQATGYSFKKCSVCHGRYCSIECQKNLWAEHRKVCKRPQ